MKTSASLSMSSYIILGLLEMAGPQTPYDLKKAIEGSIAYFWNIPHAQLYADPERLVGLGLLADEREEAGRRRHSYRITEQGRAALHAWLRDPTLVPVELRDTGLLKLYFGFALARDEVVDLAKAQAEMHRQRLHEYEQIAQWLPTIPGGTFAFATLRMGVQYERLSIAYWDEIARNPPTPSEADQAQPL